MLLPSAWAARGLDYIFMHDNASCHTAHIIPEWMAENAVQCCMWLPQSPDLNPIENLWDYIESKLEKVPSTTSKHLSQTVKNIWHCIP